VIRYDIFYVLNIRITELLGGALTQQWQYTRRLWQSDGQNYNCNMR